MSQFIACSHTVLPDQICPAEIEISGSKIVQVQVLTQNEFASYNKKNAQKITDKMLSPAFINAHTHLPMSFFRAFPLEKEAENNLVEDSFFKLEEKLTYEDVRAFARMGAYESLLFGVGFVWDHFYYGEAIAKALQDVGLSGVVAPTLQDLSGPGCRWSEQQWQDTLSIHQNQEFADQGIFAAFGPHATDTVSDDLWRKIAKASKQYQIPIHAHLAQSREEWMRCQEKTGLSPLAHLHKLGVLDEASQIVFAHALYMSEADAALLNPKKHKVVFCPFSQMVFDLPAQIMMWEKAKLEWAIATDCVACNDSMNVQKELRVLSGMPMLSTSFSPEYTQFLASSSAKDLEKVALLRKQKWGESSRFRDSQWLLDKVWKTPGNFKAGLSVGSLTPGSLANLVVWDLGHPAFWPSQRLRALSFCDTQGAIDHMMVAGQWKGVSGQFQSSILTSKAYKNALEEAQIRLNSLQQRRFK